MAVGALMSSTVIETAADKASSKKLTVVWESPMAQVLFETVEEQGRAIRPRTAKAVIEKVGIYAKELGMEQALTRELLLLAVQRAKDLKEKSLVDFLEIKIAMLVRKNDYAISYLAGKLQLEGLNRPFSIFGLQKAVLLASRAMARSRSWVYHDSYQENPERLWSSIIAHGGNIDEGIDAIGREETGLRQNSAPTYKLTLFEEQWLEKHKDDE
jgi:hypothetical protein